MPLLKSPDANEADETNEYSTAMVESHPDMWTAKISRTGVSSAGQSETVSGLVNVGSITHLLTMLHPDATKSK
jgi:hypothetical protein